ncbi:hypothetical protein [Microlunatus soli]|uniref:Uncharacterized protein n=1 Tax=Microlunatus soli TaxID=630515 RepID=A0A1H1QJB3_9ACTN|nr:hypothetical protein [Microlunatus soli]SDS22999.1 hypothetical protein SAMN04489812_1277 [Microlunatus soli]
MKQEDLGLDVEQLIDRQAWLQSSAQALMDEIGLRAILESAGRVWKGLGVAAFTHEESSL